MWRRTEAVASRQDSQHSCISWTSCQLISMNFAFACCRGPRDKMLWTRSEASLVWTHTQSCVLANTDPRPRPGLLQSRNTVHGICQNNQWCQPGLQCRPKTCRTGNCSISFYFWMIARCAVYVWWICKRWKDESKSLMTAGSRVEKWNIQQTRFCSFGYWPYSSLFSFRTLCSD